VGKLRPLDGIVVAVGVWQQVQIWSSARAGTRLAVVPLELAFVAALLARDRLPAASRGGAVRCARSLGGFHPA